MSGSARSPWYAEAFGAAYLDVYAHRSDAAAEEETAFVAEVLGVGPGLRLLDAGCGAGRHARALAARGADVTGLDLSADLLRQARERGGGPRYVRGDLRGLPFRSGEFAAVASLFTTFGYFDDAGNAAQLAEVRRVLAPRGRFLLDFLNADRVRATLVPRSEREQDGRRIVEERAIRAGRVEKDVTIEEADRAPRSWRESVRLYERDELVALVGAAGFDVSAVVGDLAGGAWASSSPRTVVIGAAA